MAKSDGDTVTVKNAREVSGINGVPVEAAPTGTRAGKPSDGVFIEGLGDISEAKSPVADDNGSGPYVVVTSHIVSGHTESFGQGRVVRLSHLIRDYDNAENAEQVKADIRRFLDLGAIRLATSEEEGQYSVEIVPENDALRIERNKRIALENQLNQLQGKTVKDVMSAGPVGDTVNNIGKPAEANWE